jgi:bacterial/archaeal transporter family-2 protein
VNRFALFAMLSGLISAVQNVIIARATKGGGLQWVVLSLSLAQAIIPALLLLNQGRGGFPADWRWPLIGGAIAGLMGTAVLTLNGLSVIQLGAGTLFVLFTGGLLVGGMVFDHFGLAGVAKNALEPVRLGGAVLVLAGAWMISR